MRILFAAIAACAWANAATAQDEERTGPPAWLAAHVVYMTAGGGRWTAQNDDLDTGVENYVMVWTPEFDGASMSGRLFGVGENGETPDFWRFNIYWHPGEERVVAVQRGAQHTLGVGEMTMTDDGAIRIAQTFFGDGDDVRVGHMSQPTDENTYVATSYLIDGEDWVERQSFTWTRARVD